MRTRLREAQKHFAAEGKEKKRKAGVHYRDTNNGRETTKVMWSVYARVLMGVCLSGTNVEMGLKGLTAFGVNISSSLCFMYYKKINLIIILYILNKPTLDKSVESKKNGKKAKGVIFHKKNNCCCTCRTNL